MYLLPGLVDDLVVLMRLLQRQLQLGKVLLEAIQLYTQSFTLCLRLLQYKSNAGFGVAVLVSREETLGTCTLDSFPIDVKLK